MGCCGMQAGMWTKIWGEGAGNLNPWNAKKNVLYRNVRTRNGKAKLRNTGMQDMKAFRNACPIAHVWFIGCFLARYDEIESLVFLNVLKAELGVCPWNAFMSHICVHFSNGVVSCIFAQVYPKKNSGFASLPIESSFLLLVFLCP